MPKNRKKGSGGRSRGNSKGKKNTGGDGGEGGGGGDGSRRCQTPPRRLSSSSYDAYCLDELEGYYDDDNFWDQQDSYEFIQSLKLPSSNSKKKETEEVYGECCICCDNTNRLVRLMKKCTHPPACYKCLRDYYIHNAQQSVQNYPLRCFNNECNQERIVHGQLLEEHGIFNSDKERTKHYRLVELAKSHKRNNANASLSPPRSRRGGGATTHGTATTALSPRSVKVAHCPHCDFPRQYLDKDNNNSTKDRLFICKSPKCKKEFAIVHSYSQTINTVNELSEQCDEDWIRCPACNIIIMKGDGCVHIICACGKEIWFDKEYRRQHKQQYLENIKEKKVELAAKTVEYYD